ncbi:MAG TPA: hypothetical protein VK502_04210 [Candidatus Saccharimonadales bacterium]|nr:hypothetical protein [Candidatus Saccharimonadales bacterium]
MSEKLVHELKRQLQAQRERAKRLGAAMVHTSTKDDFILSGPEGSLHVYREGRSMRIFLHTAKKNMPFSVDFVYGQIPRSLKPSVLEFLVRGSKEMEVAPLLYMPYGIVNKGRLVGVCFTTDRAGQGAIDRLGLVPDIYVVADIAPKWLSTPVPNLATWLGCFWAEYGAKRVINLSPRLVCFQSPIHVYAKGEQNWLAFDDSDGQKPTILEGKQYILWDHVTGRPAQKVRSGGNGYGYMNDKFTYYC